jgi:serine protease Do
VKRFLALVTSVSMAVAACGGGDSSSGDDDESGASPTSVESTEVESDREGAISDKQDVRDAVVRIVAEGSFRDPDFGEQSFSGSGSGFLISADGLIVTNQHVVEGAGSLDVFLEGDDRPKNARILGVSECNDLAVLDLEGDGYPYLEWFTDEPEPGVDAWAAGFPLGDPEYSLTRGSIVKAQASGDTGWASIEYALEHDANTQPGNSGGPLVSEDGRVIGVVYAGGDIGGYGTNQFFAIPGEIARRVADILATGVDQDSIGVNGFIVSYEDVEGLWVSGVRAGSPASDLGLKEGDIITEIGGRAVVTDSDLDADGYPTKAGYCDVLRTQGTDRAIAVTILRYDTGEILAGELNNENRPLEIEATIAGAITEGEVTGGYYDYEVIEDDTGAMQVEVPTAWTDREGFSWEFLGVDYPRVDVSYDLEGYYQTWNTSGLTVIAAPGLDESNFASTLEFFDASSACTYLTTENFDNGDLFGIYDVYSDCGGVTGSFYVVSAFYDAFYDAMVIVLAFAVDEIDLEVVDRALGSVYLP